jgi:hypothetical protein
MKKKVHHGDAHRLAADRRHAGDRRVLLAGLALGGLEAVGIAHARVAELERVSGLEIGVPLRERVGIGEDLKIRARRDPEVVAAVRAGPEVLFEHALEQRLATAFALGPQAFGKVGSLDLLRLDAGALAFEPGHGHESPNALPRQTGRFSMARHHTRCRARRRNRLMIPRARPSCVKELRSASRSRWKAS